MDATCPVVDQDEIVSCAIHFGEVQHYQIVAAAVIIVMSSQIGALPDDVLMFSYPP
jgi:hypothetical protein